jgi:predicted ATP-dependent serine protease
MIKQQYTITKTETGYALTQFEGLDQIQIGIDHPKYDWVGKNQGRVVNINGNRWTSMQDYYNYYGTNPKPTKETKAAGAEAKKAPTVINLTKLDDLNINPDLFEPMLTNTVFDKFISQDGGFLPGSNIMAAGAPGVGKTTVLLDLLSSLHQAGKRVLFISAEMNQIDMARYLKRFPQWGQLPILFLADYTDQDPKSVIETTLNQGWDLVLTDSYTEVNDTVKEECDMSRGKTEKWFLDLMSAHNRGENATKTYTTFVTILQLSKGGNFVGSNKLKHMTTAMMQLDWEGNENGNRRYMEFSKNRLGQVGKKLYFTLDQGVQFDEARYSRDLFNDALVAEEKKRLAEEDGAFDKLFGLAVDVVDAEAEIGLDLVDVQSVAE